MFESTQFTIKYGDLIDNNIITVNDLPAAWQHFPSVALPNDDKVSFIDLFYRVYQNRQIAGDTIPVFLRFLDTTTFEVLEMLPNGIYSNLLAAAVTVESDETRVREYKAAPNGQINAAYSLGGETETITRKREYESELERAEHLLKDGKPLIMWIIDRFDKCFMGVY